jgi:hypothetical protein
MTFKIVCLLFTSNVSNHVSEESVAGDVEGDAEPHVARPLIQLTRQLAVRHVKLEIKI